MSLRYSRIYRRKNNLTNALGEISSDIDFLHPEKLNHRNLKWKYHNIYEMLMIYELLKNRTITSSCVKCEGDQLTKDCQRTVKNEIVKFVLCFGNHSVNYKSCMYYQTIGQKKFTDQRKWKFLTKQENHT